MKNFWRIAYGILFILAGGMHFVRPEFYLQMMPPYLPLHREAVVVSGVAEIMLGLLLCRPSTSRLAAWGLVLLLIAIFPANVYMAAHPELFPGMPDWAPWARLPLQFVLIFWAYRFTKK